MINMSGPLFNGAEQKHQDNTLTCGIAHSNMSNITGIGAIWDRTCNINVTMVELMLVIESRAPS